MNKFLKSFILKFRFFIPRKRKFQIETIFKLVALIDAKLLKYFQASKDLLLSLFFFIWISGLSTLILLLVC